MIDLDDFTKILESLHDLESKKRPVDYEKIINFGYQGLSVDFIIRGVRKEKSRTSSELISMLHSYEVSFKDPYLVNQAMHDKSVDPTLFTINMPNPSIQPVVMIKDRVVVTREKQELLDSIYFESFVDFTDKEIKKLQAIYTPNKPVSVPTTSAGIAQKINEIRMSNPNVRAVKAKYR